MEGTMLSIFHLFFRCFFPTLTAGTEPGIRVSYSYLKISLIVVIHVCRSISSTVGSVQVHV